MTAREILEKHFGLKNKWGAIIPENSNLKYSRRHFRITKGKFMNWEISLLN